jgi:hypothetical protein
MQFRPDTFSINETIIQESRKVLGDLVPRIEQLGVVRGIRRAQDAAGSDQLQAYLLDKIPGITLEELQNTSRTDEQRLFILKRRLVRDLGVVFARTYVTCKKTQDTKDEHFQKGKVGNSLAWRLQLLQNIASKEVRTVVDEVQEALGDIEALPWCLTHGDLVPANIIVDPSSGRLCGLIDWAEGEYLPFGVGLYGLEEILGHTQHGVFEYHPYHEFLRTEFWDSFNTALRREGCAIQQLEMENVLLARKLGILLWRGIAFENGRLDRVVQAGASSDDLELHKLHLFLATAAGNDALIGSKDSTLGWCLWDFTWFRPYRVWYLVKGVCMFMTGKFRMLYQLPRISS